MLPCQAVVTVFPACLFLLMCIVLRTLKNLYTYITTVETEPSPNPHILSKSLSETGFAYQVPTSPYRPRGGFSSGIRALILQEIPQDFS